MNLKDFVSKPLFDEHVVLKKDPSWPEISIVTPSYNQGQFLERTILSVLNQNYPNLEYIIIDGGSHDNSVEIIRKYENYLAYWVSEKDNGQSHALNKGFRLCSGKYIGWQNSDDIYLPNTLREFAVISQKHLSYEIYYANKVNIDEHDRLLRKVTYARPVKAFMKFYARYRGMTFCNLAAFFRSSVFKDVGEIDERFNIAMDMDYFFRCIIAGKKFHYTNSVWGAWRRHSAAKTATNFRDDPKRQAEREIFVKKHHLYRGPGYKFLSLLAYVWRRVLLLIR